MQHLLKTSIRSILSRGFWFPFPISFEKKIIPGFRSLWSVFVLLCILSGEFSQRNFRRISLFFFAAVVFYIFHRQRLMQMEGNGSRRETETDEGVGGEGRGGLPAGWKRKVRMHEKGKLREWKNSIYIILSIPFRMSFSLK